jgi:regulator of sigma E protease
MLAGVAAESMTLHTFLGNVPGYLLVALVFLVMISILVFAHEMGHYLFARLFNMGVEEFAIGFGKNPLLTYAQRKYVIPVMPGEDPNLPSPRSDDDQRAAAFNMAATLEGVTRASNAEIVETSAGQVLHESTKFTVRPIPAGGFVRIKGMLPEEDGSEIRIPGGFYSKAPWKRFIVLLAGPAFSVLAGILILVPVFMADGITRYDQKPVLGEVKAGFAAERAHLHTGDRIISIAGKPVVKFYDFLKVITTNAGVPLALKFERDGKVSTTIITPEKELDPSNILDEDLQPTADMARQGRIGTVMSKITIYPSFSEALAESVKAPIDTVVGIARVFEKPSRFSNSVSGPGQMVSVTNMAIQEGIYRVLELMAYLSISVGIFNLLPFPPLDGGQMAIALAEMFRGGRRLSLQIQGLISTVGLLAVVLLMFSAIYVDFKQLTKPAPKQLPPLPPAAKAAGAPKPPPPAQPVRL